MKSERSLAAIVACVPTCRWPPSCFRRLQPYGPLSFKSFTLSSLALALVACGASVDAHDEASVEVAHVESGEEWARCWLTDSAEPLAATHRDVVCRAGNVSLPLFERVAVEVGGASRPIGPEAAAVATIGRDISSATLVFTPSAGPAGLGLHELRRGLELSGTSEMAPAIVRSPFTTWTVTVDCSQPFSLSLLPYAVSLGSYSSDSVRPMIHPQSASAFVTSLTTTLIVPSSGTIEGNLQFASGPRPIVAISGSGHFTATTDGLRPFGTVEPAPLPSGCGEPGEDCCETGGACVCKPFRGLNVFGKCFACGDENVRACRGGVCRPGLTVNEESICVATR